MTVAAAAVVVVDVELVVEDGGAVVGDTVVDGCDVAGAVVVVGDGCSGATVVDVVVPAVSPPHAAERTASAMTAAMVRDVRIGRG